jgi:hypothetical protein
MLASLRSGEGRPLVDEFARLRAHSGKAQLEYATLAATVKGTISVLASQLEQRDMFRKSYYPPSLMQAIEGPIRREQAQIADARAKEAPLGQDVLATYSRACHVLARLGELAAKRLSAMAQGGN